MMADSDEPDKELALQESGGCSASLQALHERGAERIGEASYRAARAAGSHGLGAARLPGGTLPLCTHRPMSDPRTQIAWFWVVQTSMTQCTALLHKP